MEAETYQAEQKAIWEQGEEDDYQEANTTMEKLLAKWVNMGRMEKINWIRRIRYGGEWL